jgi:hypothetical protein
MRRVALLLVSCGMLLLSGCSLYEMLFSSLGSHSSSSYDRSDRERDYHSQVESWERRPYEE